MSDIVERLRNPMFGAAAEVCVDMNEAADEIERLRATIEQLRSVAGAVSLDTPRFGQIKKDTRNG